MRRKNAGAGIVEAGLAGGLAAKLGERNVDASC
jgi:hypothetical protein